MYIVVHFSRDDDYYNYYCEEKKTQKQNAVCSLFHLFISVISYFFL